MKPPSLQAGEYGTWVATTDISMDQSSISAGQLPPVGVFLTSNILHQMLQQYSGGYRG